MEKHTGPALLCLLAALSIVSVLFGFLVDLITPPPSITKESSGSGTPEYRQATLEQRLEQESEARRFGFAR